MSAKRFARAAVCSPHALASEAGRAVLASGGNALDAAIATNLTLGVVAPYLCGYGGDLFALIWRDGLHAYNGSGRAPAAATPDAVRAAIGGDRMPPRGPHTVTVPGAVEAWFALLERFGSRSFAELAQPALAYARDGFVPTERGARWLSLGVDVYDDAHRGVYAPARAGEPFVQHDLARTIDALSADGPGRFYERDIAEEIVAHVRAGGGLLVQRDLATHRGDWIEPLRTRWRDVEIVELPPNTQGIAVLEALGIAGDELPHDETERAHLLIEAVKLAQSDINAGRESLDPDSLAANRARITDRAGAPSPGPAPGGGTAYMCATDGWGMCVSLIQSNWQGFGSGLTVPGWGINLHSRGAFFSLDENHPHVIAPGKRPFHTLIPAMALRDDKPFLVFGTEGGTGQSQTHVQLLARIIADGADPQDALDAPRWVCRTTDWQVSIEEGFGPAVIDGLRERGHDARTTEPLNGRMGQAHAILVDGDGFLAATDPRAEGAALGV